MKKLMNQAHSMMSLSNIRKAKTMEEKIAELSKGKYVKMYNEEKEREESNWARIESKIK